MCSQPVHYFARLIAAAGKRQKDEKADVTFLIVNAVNKYKPGDPNSPENQELLNSLIAQFISLDSDLILSLGLKDGTITKVTGLVVDLAMGTGMCII
jgi:hypothetical protein